LAYINLDRGTRRPLKGVDSLGFRMHCPVGGDQSIELRRVWLSVEDPGDAYLGVKPAVDQFGQWNLGEFEGKVHSPEELQAEWAKEDAAIETFKKEAPVRSQYGGLLKYTTKASGFFRVEKIEGKWWFVDPEGYLFLSLGANGTSPNTGGNMNPPKGAYTMTPPEGFKSLSRGRRGGEQVVETTPALTGQWNLFRRYGGDSTVAKAEQKVVERMDYWGMNTMGSWSGLRANPRPYMTYTRAGGTTNIFGLVDIYVPGFKERVEESIQANLERSKGDKMLIGYFIGNEPSFCNQENRLAELIMEANDTIPLKQAYLAYIGKHGGASSENNKAFAYVTFREYVGIICSATRKYDSNHLILGIRFGRGVPAKEVLSISKEYFDVYSFNDYGMNPMEENNVNYGTMTVEAPIASSATRNIFDEIYKATGLPMIIGEYHFGTTDRGLGESLVRVNSQEERGIAFRNYSDKAFSHPALIGLSWFQWNDQELFGRGDGENYNIGLVDITDRPYPHMVEAIRSVARDCYEIHRGTRPPYFKQLYRYGGEFPDVWQ